MGRPSKYKQEFRERAVRLVLEQRDEYASEHEAIRPGLTSAEHEQIKALKRENAGLRRANEILKAAAFKIALSSSTCRTLAFNTLTCSRSSLVRPARWPVSTWAGTAHWRTVAAPTPNCIATAADAAVNKGCSPACSVTRGKRRFDPGGVHAIGP